MPRERFKKHSMRHLFDSIFMEKNCCSFQVQKSYASFSGDVHVLGPTRAGRARFKGVSSSVSFKKSIFFVASIVRVII